MDFNKQIINIVQEYPILYDRKHKLFFHEKANNKTWDDIGQRLGRPGPQCRATYMSLYMKFGIHHVMVTTPEMAQMGFPKQNFPYYNDMLPFYKNHIHLVRAQKRAKNIIKVYRRTHDPVEKKKFEDKRAWKIKTNNLSCKARKILRKKGLLPDKAQGEGRSQIQGANIPAAAPVNNQEPLKTASCASIASIPNQTKRKQPFPKNQQNPRKRIRNDFSEDYSLDALPENWAVNSKSELPQKPQIIENPVPVTQKSQEIFKVKEKSQVPQVTQKPEVPQVTKNPQVPHVTQKPEVPQVTRKPQVPQTTQKPQPQVPQLTKRPQVPPVIQKPEVPQVTRKPQVPQTTQKPQPQVHPVIQKPVNAEEVDFFFKSVSQQIKRANISPNNFSNLKVSILKGLSGKIPFKQK